MRWSRGDRSESRDRSGFLLLPKRIGGETRWLERATWREAFLCEGWFAVAWIDEPIPYRITDAGRALLEGK